MLHLMGQPRAQMEIISAFAAAFSAKDWEAVGRLVGRSQDIGDGGLQNLVPETRWLPARAKELGAIGASAFGAG